MRDCSESEDSRFSNDAPMILFPDGKPGVRESYAEYVEAGGYEAVRRASAAADILHEVAASGLRGRGGAGFPVDRKWSIAAATSADRRYVVCNGGEDEPGSFKDRMLLECRPHLVLEGAILAARAIDASEVIFYINETYLEAMQCMGGAISEAQEEDLFRGLTIRIEPAPTVYVAGEDSAC